MLTPEELRDALIDLRLSPGVRNETAKARNRLRRRQIAAHIADLDAKLQVAVEALEDVAARFHSSVARQALDEIKEKT